MRKIKQIIPINLKRREDKLIAYYGAMHTSFTPYELIKPFEAHDGADYPDAFAVREAAQQEFPFWSEMTDEWIRAGWLGRGSLCCLWSMQCVLKLISEDPDKNDFSFFSTDGVPFVKNWWYLCNHIEEIPSNFNIFQLWHWEEPEYPYAPHYPELINFYFLGANHINQVSKGLAGAGDALLLTPEGAARVLQWSSENPCDCIEYLMFKKAHEDPPDCLSTVNRYEWVRPHIDFEPYFNRISSERSYLDKTETSSPRVQDDNPYFTEKYQGI